MLLKSQVKYIQSLGQKKFRDTEGAFIAEGPKIVNEILKESTAEPIEIFALKEWITNHRELLDKSEPHRITEIPSHQLERLSGLSTPNQVLGIFRKPRFIKHSISKKISLALENIQDPGNLGTIIRIADWFGLSEIFCSESSADAFNPKTIQASMGSIARIQVHYKNLTEFFQENEAIEKFATLPEGPGMFEIKPPKEAIILIGNESQGISSGLLSFCRNRISIPRKGHAESLNAAIATGIILSHFVH
jgi:RNA methyltransferase, TrmH family